MIDINEQRETQIFERFWSHRPKQLADTNKAAAFMVWIERARVAAWKEQNAKRKRPKWTT